VDGGGSLAGATRFGTGLGGRTRRSIGFAFAAPLVCFFFVAVVVVIL
jgi:hypothetical protein